MPDLQNNVFRREILDFLRDFKDLMVQGHYYVKDHLKNIQALKNLGITTRMRDEIILSIAEEANSMHAFCPNCEKETSQHFINRVEEIKIRELQIPVHLEYYVCEECGKDYEKPQPDYDPLDAAYREYRKRKGMLQPEDIRSFRKEIGLTQDELSRVLGIGIATLNRYEKGALQTDAHDQVIQLLKQPANLLNVLQAKPELLDETTRKGLIHQLLENSILGGDLLENAVERFGNYAPDLFSGYLRFDATKLFQAMKYFCFGQKIIKRMLVELLFTADFKHFKEHGVSITGARYAYAKNGPVLLQATTWLAAASEWKSELICEDQSSSEYLAEIYTSGEPEYKVFSPSELSVLAAVKDRFQNLEQHQIKETFQPAFSYRKAKNGELISYQLAHELEI